MSGFKFYLSICAVLWSALALGEPSKFRSVNLSSLSPTDQLSISLQGEWRIYPGQLLQEKDLPELGALPSATLEIPTNSWISVAPQKYATIVLPLTDLPDRPLVVLFSQFFYTHRSFFAWQDERGWHLGPLVQTGQVADNKLDNIMEGKRVMARLPRQVKSGYLLIQMSNFYGSGRIIGAPSVGLYPEFARIELVTKRWEAFFVLGCFFLLFISNFALFLQRPEDRPSLSMALVAVSLGIRYCSTEALWVEMFPGPKQLIWTLTSLGTIIGNLMPVYFMLSFASRSFPDYFPRKIVFGFRFLAFFTIAWTLTYLPNITAGPPLLSYLIFLFVIPYSLVQTARAAWNGQRGAALSTTGMAVMALAMVNDGLVAVAHVYDFIFVGHYGMLVYVVTQSMVVGKNFAHAFRTAHTLSRELKQEVERQTRDAKAILNCVLQGLLTLQSDGKVNDDYASFVKELFQVAEPSGQNIRQLLLEKSNLSQEQQDNVLTVLCTAVGEDPLAFELNVDNLPTQMIYEGNKILELNWQAIVNEKSRIVTKILLSIRDVTTIRELEKKNLEVQQDMQMIARLLEVSSEKFLIFYRSSQDMIEESLRLIKQAREFDPDTVRLLFVNMHTIKGAARTYGFIDMTAEAHLCEQYYAQVQKIEKPWDPSLARWHVEAVSKALNQYYAINRYKLRRDAEEHVAKLDMKLVRDNILELQKISGTILNPELIPFVNKARSTFFGIYYTDSMVVLGDVTAKLPALAKDLGKEAPEVLMLGHGFGLTIDACEVLRRAFVHLLRNAMDHGIETSLERLSQGKPAKGILTIQQRESADGSLEILLRDDGAGLNLARIHQKAVAQGLRNPTDPLNPDELSQLIFRPGFSTAKTVSEISGRGVGLDAVKQSLADAGGSVTIEILEYYEGSDSCSFQFRLCLPADLWVQVDQASPKSA